MLRSGSPVGCRPPRSVQHSLHQQLSRMQASRTDRTSNFIHTRAVFRDRLANYGHSSFSGNPANRIEEDPSTTGSGKIADRTVQESRDACRVVA